MSSPPLPPLQPPPPPPPPAVGIPTGPPLDFELAGVGRRAGAFALDWIFITAMAFLGLVLGGSILLSGGQSRRPVAGMLDTLPQIVSAAIVFFSLFALPFVYLGIGWRRGATPGMRVFGLRVVDAHGGGRLNWAQSLLRYAGYWWSLATLGTGFLVAAFDDRKRGLPDRLASSLVVKTEAIPLMWAPGPYGWTPLWARPPRPLPLDPSAPVMAEPPVTRSPWTWTDVVPSLLLLLPILFGVTFVVGLSARGLGIGAANRPLVSTFADVAAYGASLLLIVTLVRVRRHAPISALGLRLPTWRWLVAGLPLAFAALVVQSLAGLVSRGLFSGSGPGGGNQCSGIKSAYGSSLLLALLAVAVIAPVAEEIIFRGFTFRYLNGRLPLWGSVVASAVIFSAAHAGWRQPSLFLPIFATGTLLAYVYAKSRSVWPGVIVHMTINTVATLATFSTPGC